MARAGEWLGSFEPDEAAFEGFIVSCVSGMDAPVKPYALTKRRNTTYLSLKHFNIIITSCFRL